MLVEALTAFDGETLKLADLKMLVIKKLAARPDNVRDYLTLMSSTNLIREVEPMLFKVTINAE